MIGGGTAHFVSDMYILLSVLFPHNFARYLAQWIRNGYAPYDLTESDPGRYGNWADDTRYICEKTRESYGMNNSYGYVKEERVGGRPSKRIHDFYSTLEKRGANFGFKAGFEVGVLYCVLDIPY